MERRVSGLATSWMVVLRSADAVELRATLEYRESGVGARRGAAMEALLGGVESEGACVRVGAGPVSEGRRSHSHYLSVVLPRRGVYVVELGDAGGGGAIVRLELCADRDSAAGARLVRLSEDARAPDEVIVSPAEAVLEVGRQYGFELRLSVGIGDVFVRRCEESGGARDEPLNVCEGGFRRGDVFVETPGPVVVFGRPARRASCATPEQTTETVILAEYLAVRTSGKAVDDDDERDDGGGGMAAGVGDVDVAIDGYISADAFELEER
jgi:hypothetical protein